MSTARDIAAKSKTKLTYREYVLFPNDGNRHEIIDGRHYMNAAPSPRHQYVSRHIQFQLMEQIEQKGFGQVINAPIDVQFSECDVVQPDIIVVLKTNRIMTPIKVKGAPDLAVEILSPSNRKYDKELKRQLYEQAGVPEYWIVDSEEQVIHQLQRSAEGVYGGPVVCSKSITYRATDCSATVDLLRVWE
jgi:Uma2 family endonuclease